jgi:hypothetical protein
VVEDPHPNELTVRAVVAGKRENIANLIVDLEYTDPGNGIHETGTLQFLPENINLPQAWTVHLADPTKRRYRYRMTLITVDEGDFIQTGWIGTDAPTLPVGEVYVRTLTVEVVTAELAAGVEAVEVELVYDDPDNDLHREDKLTLSANSRQEWKVLLKDAAKRAYQATITWVHSDGFNPKVGPVTRTGTLMVIAGDRPEDG